MFRQLSPRIFCHFGLNKSLSFKWKIFFVLLKSIFSIMVFHLVDAANWRLNLLTGRNILSLLSRITTTAARSIRIRNHTWPGHNGATNIACLFLSCLRKSASFSSCENGGLHQDFLLTQSNCLNASIGALST